MLSKRYQCLLIVAGSLALSMWWFASCISRLDDSRQLSAREIASLLPFSCWITCGALLTVAGVFFDMYSLEPSAFHTYKSLVVCYLLFKAMALIGYFAERRFEQVCRNIEKTQRATLRSILEHAASTEFAKDYCISQIRTAEEFRKRIPLTLYEDYLPYVNRAVNGEDNVMFPEKVDFIATTTGTTSSKSKLYPKSMKIVNKLLQKSSGLTFWANSPIPGVEKLHLWVKLGYPAKASYTDRGIKSGPISSAMSLNTIPLWTTPEIADDVDTEEQKNYIDLLFSLRDRDISVLFTLVAPAAVALFKALETQWTSLCDDIEHGTLNSAIHLTTNVRMQLEENCIADPLRADELRAEFHKGFDGIVPRIWQKCKLLVAVSSGTFRVYAEQLKQKYLGDVILFSQSHVATEGVYAVNLWPPDTEYNYAVLAESMFYEFLSVDDEAARTLMLHEIEIGQQYELVVTTWEGLYRFPTGDIIQVTRFHNQMPLYKFVRRTGDILNVHTEKVPVEVVSQALMEIFSNYKGRELLDYICTEAIHFEQARGDVQSGRYYVIFVETEGGPTVSLQDSREVDDRLCELTDWYGIFRNRGIIQDLRIIEVKKGTFEKFKSQRMANNPKMSSAQYKTPRIIRKEEFIQLFIEQSVVALD